MKIFKNKSILALSLLFVLNFFMFIFFPMVYYKWLISLFNLEGSIIELTSIVIAIFGIVFLIIHVLVFTISKNEISGTNQINFGNLPIASRAIIGIGILLFISIVLYSSRASSAHEVNSKNCVGVGNEGCISKVRERFSNTGKNILGEEYLGNGTFGISFMDTQHPGAFKAKVFTDCNCNITNVDISTIH